MHLMCFCKYYVLCLAVLLTLLYVKGFVMSKSWKDPEHSTQKTRTGNHIAELYSFLYCGPQCSRLFTGFLVQLNAIPTLSQSK